MPKDKYSYFVNIMLFFFVLFVNINNTVADIALFSLSIAGVYILKKNNINPFKDNNLRTVLLITTGYYLINLVVFFVNGTYFAKYLQTDIYFLLAVFIAAGIFYARINMNLFFTGIRLALLYLGVSQYFLSDDWQNGYSNFTNIYISMFAPVTVLMMFLSIINYDNDNLINKLFGLSAFISGLILIENSSIRLSWIVFIILTLVVIFLMFKKIFVSKLALMVSLILLGGFIYFIYVNKNVIWDIRVSEAISNVYSWRNDSNLNTPVGLRLEMYSAGLEAFKEKPFFGHGYLNGPKEASKYADPRLRDSINNFVQLHSEYITTMVEKGFFGLLSLGILLFSPTRTIVRNYSKDNIYIRIGVISNISFVLFGLLNVSFGDTTIKAFYVILICLFLPNLYERKV
jgi:O-antigen ligase